MKIETNIIYIKKWRLILMNNKSLEFSNREHWDKMHSWRICDLQDLYDTRRELLDLLKKHPLDKMSVSLKSMAVTTENKIKALRKEYKKVYGEYPKNNLLTKY